MLFLATRRAAMRCTVRKGSWQADLEEGLAIEFLGSAGRPDFPIEKPSLAV